jgi:transcriptional regulator with XRE-family HTH domain
MRYRIDKLIQARLLKGWDQTTLAFHAGLSVAQICRIEKGKHQKPATIEKIARILDVRMRELFIEDDEEPPRRTA